MSDVSRRLSREIADLNQQIMQKQADMIRARNSAALYRRLGNETTAARMTAQAKRCEDSLSVMRQRLRALEQELKALEGNGR